MTEPLTQKVKRIIAGGAHALVEAIEDAAPEMVLEQAAREVETAMEDVRAELGRSIAHRHLANKRLAQENEKHEVLSGQIELALAQGREDLAEFAISQQLDIEAQLPLLEQSIHDAAASEKELEACLAALGAKRREMTKEDNVPAQPASQLAQLEELSRKHRIHERLSAMKAGSR